MLATDDSSWLDRLPTELIDIISSGNDGAMSRAEAEVYRLGLMDERKDSIFSLREVFGLFWVRVRRVMSPCSLVVFSGRGH